MGNVSGSSPERKTRDLDSNPEAGEIFKLASVIRRPNRNLKSWKSRESNPRPHGSSQTRIHEVYMLFYIGIEKTIITKENEN